jgi:hypothetical protein
MGHSEETKAMATKRTPVEQANSATQRAAMDQRSSEPLKVEGPQHAAFSKEEIHAASLLHAPSGTGSAPERARRMAALQRLMGNARLTRLLGELGVQQESGVGPEQIPKRE